MLTFDDFWFAYPPRKGGNPKAAARTKWDVAIKKGVEPEIIVNAALKFRDEMRESESLGTSFVPMARTWLFQQRYLDYVPDPDKQERNAKTDADMLKRGYIWKGEKWINTKQL
jgi:hypothetical protein